MCGIAQAWAQLIIKYYCLGKMLCVPLVRNIQKSKEICSQCFVTPEGLLGDQAQIKEDLSVLPENDVLESSKFKYIPIRV
jgi:hypothetical protein